MTPDEDNEIDHVYFSFLRDKQELGRKIVYSIPSPAVTTSPHVREPSGPIFAPPAAGEEDARGNDLSGRVALGPEHGILGDCRADGQGCDDGGHGVDKITAQSSSASRDAGSCGSGNAGFTDRTSTESGALKVGGTRKRRQSGSEARGPVSLGRAADGPPNDCTAGQSSGSNARGAVSLGRAVANGQTNGSSKRMTADSDTVEEGDPRRIEQGGKKRPKSNGGFPFNERSFSLTLQNQKFRCLSKHSTVEGSWKFNKNLDLDLSVTAGVTFSFIREVDNLRIYFPDSELRTFDIEKAKRCVQNFKMIGFVALKLIFGSEDGGVREHYVKDGGIQKFTFVYVLKKEKQLIPVFIEYANFAKMGSFDIGTLNLNCE